MVSINTNSMNLIVQKNLSSANLGVATAMERMSTGYRINSAKDDAAGYAVASGIMSQIKGLTQAQKNTQDGISLLNLASSSVGNMSKIAQRIKELSIQAANETYGIESRKAMQAEADALIKQLYQIKNTTSFNGINVLGKEEQFFTTSPFGGGTGATTFSATSAATFAGMEATAKLATSFKMKSAIIEEEPQKTEPDMQTETMLTKSAEKARSTALTAAGNTITGSIDLASSGAEKTKTVNIDGTEYTFTNNLATDQQVSYSKDVNSGELTFFGTNLTIKGQKDKEHNVILNGKSLTFEGGDLADTIQVAALSINFVIKGGKGNDIIKSENNSYGTVYGEDGDDNISICYSTTVVGGAGNDTITAIAPRSGVSTGSNTLNGGDGDDIINVYSSTNKLNGDNGEDTFSIFSGSNNMVNGGAGTNLLAIDAGIETVTVKVPGANSFIEEFNASETKTLLIDGKNYTIKNNTGAQTLIYQVNAGVVEFKAGTNLTITAQSDMAHNVKIWGNYTTFEGGDLDDTITVASGAQYSIIKGGKGNDTITNNGHYSNLYGGDGDDIITDNYAYNAIYGEAGNDTIYANHSSANASKYEGGIGNDTIYVNYSGQTVNGNEGDDTFILKTGITNTNIIGGIGNNNIIGNGATNTLKTGFGADDNSFEVKFGSKNETQEIEINGIKYTVKNDFAGENSFGYNFDAITGEINFFGRNFTIEGQKDKEHNVVLRSGYTTFTGGDLDDKIVSRSAYSKVYGGAGDDDINVLNGNGSTAYGDDGNDTMRGTCTKYGGDGDDIIYVSGSGNLGEGGNDTYYINNNGSVVMDQDGDNIFYVNSSGNSITAGSGSDSFYITGSDNQVIQGGAGDDFFSIDGNSNNVIGGTGENYFVVNGNTNTIQGGPDNKDLIVDNGIGNNSSNVTTDPNAGFLSFTSVGQEITFTIAGKTYTVKNQNESGTAPAMNSLRYFLNQNTGELTLEGSNLTITGENDKSHNLVIKGGSNTINGGNLDDKIMVQTGSDNTINGQDGHDTIITNTANNKIQGGKGNDNITVNAENGANLIDGGDGDDVLNINSSNNSNILGGNGNDKINANGSNNIINSGDGNDNVLAIGNSNQITSTSGNNTLNAKGDGNTIIGGAGSDIIGVDGKNNTATAGDGNNTLNIIGEFNTATSGNGNDNINISGSNNQASTTSGNNSFNIKGNSNTVEGGDSADKITVAGKNNTANGNDGDDSFNVSSNADDNTIDGGAGYNTLYNKGTNTTATNVRDITPDPTVIRLQVGTDGSDNSGITFTSSFDLGDFVIDFSTEEKARESMEAIDAIIANLTSKNAEYGAITNRLNSALEMQSVSINNLTAAHSSIMDADIAVESSNFVKNKILEQASASLLSQTKNIQSSLILGLLPIKR